MKIVNMEKCPPEFEEILKKARDSAASNPSAQQIVAILTSKGRLLCCVNHDVDSGSVADEEAFVKTLAESGDTQIQYAVCMWSNSTLDVPSCHLRNLLAELDPSNREAEFLLKGEGFSVKSLKEMGASSETRIGTSDTES